MDRLGYSGLLSVAVMFCSAPVVKGETVALAGGVEYDRIQKA
jgi:hypothetical protein